MSVRDLIFVLPGLFGDAEAEPVSTFGSGLWSAFAEGCEIVRLRPLPDDVTREWISLGVNPAGKSIADGPLMIASMRLEPPQRSVHFRLSLASLDEFVTAKPPPPTPEEATTLAAAVSRLETRSLTPAWRQGLDHGLVWLNGSLELLTWPICELDGQPIAGRLPEGDGERILRRLIDDSIDLLSGLECNRIRQEEGILPLNLLWPWGFGFRPDIPNLALRRGVPIRLVSESWRLEGLARMTGDWHSQALSLTRGVHPDWSTVKRLVESGEFIVVWLDHAVAMRRMSRFDELDYLASGFADTFLPDLIAERGTGDTVMTVVAPGIAGAEGLAACWRPGVLPTNPYPLDERVLDDPRVPSVDPWQPIRTRWEHR